MARNRALGSPYQVETVVEDFTTSVGVDAYMVDAVPLTVTLDPYAANGDQVVIQDITDSAGSNPIVVNVSEGQTILNGHGDSISIGTNGGSVQLTMTKEGWVPQLLGAASSSVGVFATLGDVVSDVPISNTSAVLASVTFMSQGGEFIIVMASASLQLVGGADASGFSVSLVLDGTIEITAPDTGAGVGAGLNAPLPATGRFGPLAAGSHTVQFTGQTTTGGATGVSVADSGTLLVLRSFN